MTRKHYRAIAALLHEHSATADLVTAFADWLTGLNPSFDRRRFLAMALRDVPLDWNKAKRS